MKKILGILFLLTIVMLVVLASCVSTNTPPQQTPTDSFQFQQDAMIMDEYNQPTVEHVDNDFDSFNSW